MNKQSLNSVLFCMLSCIFSSAHAMFVPSLRLARQVVSATGAEQLNPFLTADARTDKLFRLLSGQYDPALQIARRAASLDIFLHKPHLRVAALLHNIGIFCGATCDISLHSATFLKDIGFTRRVSEPVKMQHFLDAYVARRCDEEEKRYWESEHPDALALARALTIAKDSRTGFKVHLEVLKDPVYQELLLGLKERV